MWSDVDMKERKEGLQQTHNRKKSANKERKRKKRKEGREGEIKETLFSSPLQMETWPRQEKPKRRKTKAKEEGKERKGREERKGGRKARKEEEAQDADQLG